MDDTLPQPRSPLGLAADHSQVTWLHSGLSISPLWYDHGFHIFHAVSQCWNGRKAACSDEVGRRSRGLEIRKGKRDIDSQWSLRSELGPGESFGPVLLGLGAGRSKTGEQVEMWLLGRRRPSELSPGS